VNLQERFTIADKTREPYPQEPSDFESIGSIAELDAVAGGSPWQGFERLAAYIFGQHGFEVSVGTVINRRGRRRQYDVIARKDGRTLLAECKQWSGSRYRLSALKRAVAQHRERAQFYEAITQEEAIPLIVTLIDEGIRVVDGVPLVPVHRLNAFISELDRFTDGGFFTGYEAGEQEEAFEEEPDEEPDQESRDRLSRTGVPRRGGSGGCR